MGLDTCPIVCWVAQDQHNTGLLGTNGFVGGGIGLATGAGLAARLKGTDGVAVSFFGDGASSHQTFHECLNLAQTLKAPVVFVCENNLYATATPLQTITENPDIASRGAAYGMRAVAVDGNDVVAVALAAHAAVQAARDGLGPTLLEARTYRSQGHHTNDPGARDIYSSFSFHALQHLSFHTALCLRLRHL